MQPSGELMTNQPGFFGGFVPTRINQGLRAAANPFGVLGDRPRFTPEEMRRLTSGVPAPASAYQPASLASRDPRIHNKPLTPAELKKLRDDQNAAVGAYTAAVPDETLASAGSSWTTHVTPAGTARESEARRMMQQYASKEYWDTEQGKAMKDLALQDKYKGDNLAGYYAAQRAVGEGSIDEIIQGMGYTGAMAEWARANKGMALREYMKKFPAGQPTMGGGVPSAPTIDQVKPTVGEQALMNAKYALYDGAPVAPGVTVGNEPGMVAGVNRSKMAELQAIVPQAKSTGAGEGAFNMQPQSAATTGYQLPAGAVGEFNMPEGADEFTKLVNAKIWRNRNELAGLPTVGGYQGQGLF
jgi:hypothetical protein